MRPTTLATPTVPAASPQATLEAIEHAAKAAVAAAVLPLIEDVTIHPIPPKPSLFPEQTAAPAEPAVPRAFIPPVPERMANRPRRMPGIDELPLPAQAELRAKRADQADVEQPERPKVGLLRRLAAVGLGRREDEDELQKPAAARRPMPVNRPSAQASAPPPPQRPAPPAPQARGPEPVSEYAKRPPHQGLDPHGRQASVQNSVPEDQLDIPAFLRRQSS